MWLPGHLSTHTSHSCYRSLLSPPICAETDEGSHTPGKPLPSHHLPRFSPGLPSAAGDFFLYERTHTIMAITKATEATIAPQWLVIHSGAPGNFLEKGLILTWDPYFPLPTLAPDLIRARASSMITAVSPEGTRCAVWFQGLPCSKRTSAPLPGKSL